MVDERKPCVVLTSEIDRVDGLGGLLLPEPEDEPGGVPGVGGGEGAGEGGGGPLGHHHLQGRAWGTGYRWQP